MIIILFLLLVFLLINLKKKSKRGGEECFESSQLGLNKKVLLWDNTFKFKSTKGNKNWAIKITTPTNNQVLYLKNSNQSNIPAMLGGLPSLYSYDKIFMPGNVVFLEFVQLPDAIQDVQMRYKNCTKSFDSEFCQNEHTTLA